MGGKAKKIVQNYHIFEILQEYENQYQILLAKHVIEKKNYVLKKLYIKGGTNKAFHQILLNEASILKLFNSQNIVKCYRMLKTSNNIYLVYNYFQGNTLEEIFELGPKFLTFSHKYGIARQICIALSQMQKHDVAHLNLTPQNIVVSKNFQVMIKQFMFAMEIPEQGEIKIKRKVPKSQFTAPEVKKNIACLGSDIYSFGKILEKLDFTRNKRESEIQDQQKRLKNILVLIQLMTHHDRQQRIDISQIGRVFFAKNKKPKKLQHSVSTLKIQSKLTKVGSERSISTAAKTQSGINPIFTDFILKVLRHRSLSQFMLRLLRMIVIDIQLQSQRSAILAFLFLKKSTRILTDLRKYLHYGKNTIGIKIELKDQLKFFKTADYFKLSELMGTYFNSLDKELQIQKKQFSSAVQTIYMNKSTLMRVNEFSRQIKDDQINQIYMNNCIKEYFDQLLGRPSVIAELKQTVIEDLLLMSYLHSFKTVQNLFQSRILLQPLNFDDQIFMTTIKQMNREQKIQTIKLNLEENNQQI